LGRSLPLALLKWLVELYIFDSSGKASTFGEANLYGSDDFLLLVLFIPEDSGINELSA
jgi:hypothetical protein